MDQWADTDYKDKEGKVIRIGDFVKYKEEIFNVYENPFSKRAAIDNDYGQCWLSDVHSDCEII
jgi:hypothetical protein